MSARRLINLFLDEGCGGSALAARLKSLHRSERGSMTLFFLAISLMFFALIALVWNTGRITSARMRVQAVADAAAYSSAVWTSRGVNLVTGANMMMVRNASAHVAAVSTQAVIAGVPANWSQALAEAALCNPPQPCIDAVLAQIAVEAPILSALIARSATESSQAVATNKFLDRVEELSDFEVALVSAIPDAIEAQRDRLEDYYGVSIRLTRPGFGNGEVLAPLVTGTTESFATALSLRFFGSDNHLPSEMNFAGMDPLGKANQIWNDTAAATIAAIAPGIVHFVLPTQNGAVEEGPQTAEQRAHFTVVATAVLENVSAGRIVAPSIFPDGVNVEDVLIAFAQAETYNPIEARLRAFNSDLPTPYRVWTTWGWSWQPRLTRSDLLVPALQGDPTMREIFERQRIGSDDDEVIQQVILH